MNYDPLIHNRHSIRWQGYDYRRAGAYFITICAHRHRYIFGEVREGRMYANRFGSYLGDQWKHTARVRPEVALDAFVVMPNHFHAIIILHDGSGMPPTCPEDVPLIPTDTDTQPRRGMPLACPYTQPGTDPSAYAQFGKPQKGALGTIIGHFKAEVTKTACRGFNLQTVWQRNFYDRVIRDPEEFERIREYIAQNPEQWEFDHENPNRIVSLKRTTPNAGMPRACPYTTQARRGTPAACPKPTRSEQDHKD